MIFNLLSIHDKHLLCLPFEILNAIGYHRKIMSVFMIKWWTHISPRPRCKRYRVWYLILFYLGYKSSNFERTSIEYCSMNWSSRSDNESKLHPIMHWRRCFWPTWLLKPMIAYHGTYVCVIRPTILNLVVLNCIEETWRVVYPVWSLYAETHIETWDPFH